MSVMDGLLNKFRINVADEEDDLDEDDFDAEFDEEEARPRKSLFQHFKSSFELDDEDEDEEDEDDFEAPSSVRSMPVRESKEPKEPVRSEKPAAKPMREEPVEVKKSRPMGGRVVPMSRVSGNASAMSKAISELYMLKPKKEEDAREAVDALLAGKVVIVNLEGLNIEIAQYVTDFVTGANYSMGGNFSTINSQVLVFTPSSIDLTGAFEENIFETRSTREH